MARSRKKTPIVKFAPTSNHSKNVSWSKRQANKKCRKLDVSVDIQDGKYYKKIYDSYNIHDCIRYVAEKDKVYFSKKDYLRK